jgi:hypothetical protein
MVNRDKIVTLIVLFEICRRMFFATQHRLFFPDMEMVWVTAPLKAAAPTVA